MLDSYAWLNSFLVYTATREIHVKVQGKLLIGVQAATTVDIIASWKRNRKKRKIVRNGME